MKGKILWLVVSCLMVISLVLASCGPAVTEEEEAVTPPPEKEKVAPAPEEEEVVAPAAEEPSYGGVYTVASAVPPTCFDEMVRYHSAVWASYPTNEELLTVDWTKGMAGEGLWSGGQSIFPAFSWQTGQLAESWERQDADTLVFHIRQGVYWHDKPPLNGREFTADDAAFYIRRAWSTAGAYGTVNYPHLADMDNLEESVYATDRWTLVIKCEPGKAGLIFEIVADYTMAVAPEVVEQYGDMNDWENVVGTGPFILVDHVSDSSLTYVRNPNYWGKDPFRPENQLPYLDGYKVLIVTDLSTRMAALRTGKIDALGALTWEDAEQLIKTNPELQWAKHLNGSPPALFPRNDTSPFDDVRVRRALAMAINQPEIVEEYYGGNADILAWPLLGNLEFQDMYTPLEELPEEARVLFEHHPDKARQLLAEAGYPDGFKTSVICYPTPAQVDVLSVIKANWAEIGVDLELEVKDYGVYLATLFKKSHEQMLMSVTASSAPFKLVMSREGSVYNWCYNEEPLPQELFERIGELYFDQEERNKFIKERYPELIARSWFFPLPAAHLFTMWQPWVMGYHGENYVGYYNVTMYIRYIWLDQDLRYETTGRR